MARLPKSGGDVGTWGEILNDFLSQAHNSDGTLKDTGVVATKYTQPAGGIPSSDLDSSVQAILTKANSPKLADLTDVNAAGVTNSQVLSFNSGTGKWIPSTVSGTAVGDATSGSKGLIKLAGDFGGTADAPTVTKINGISVSGTPTANQAIVATSGSAASWADLPSAPVSSVAGKTGIVSLAKTDVGLANVDNTSDANKPVSTATQTALNLKESLANKGAAGGYAALDGSSKIPISNLNVGTTSGTVAAGDDSRLVAAQNKLAPTAVKSSAYPAAAFDLVPVDVSSTSVTVTLPAAPADGSLVGVKLVAVGGSNTATISTAGSDVFNKTAGPTTASLSLLNQVVTYQYHASDAIWYEVGSGTPLSQTDVRYFKAAGTGVDLDMNGHKIKGSADGSSDTDLATLKQANKTDMIITANPLRRIRSAIANRASTPVNIVIAPADSEPVVGSWVTPFAQMCQRAFGGGGTAPNYGNAGPSLTSPITTNQTLTGLAQISYQLTGSTSKLTYPSTSGRYVNVYYRQLPTGGNMSVKVTFNGVANTVNATVDTGNATDKGGRVVTYDLGSVGTINNVFIQAVAGGALNNGTNIFVESVVTSSTAGGVHILNGGHIGYTSVDFASTLRWTEGFDNYAPDLIIMALGGGNDSVLATPTPQATFQANILAEIDAMLAACPGSKPAPSILMIGQWPTGGGRTPAAIAPYITALKNIRDLRGYDFLDMGDILGDLSSSDPQGLLLDTVHTGVLGGEMYAQAIFGRIFGDLGGVRALADLDNVAPPKALTVPYYDVSSNLNTITLSDGQVLGALRFGSVSPFNMPVPRTIPFANPDSPLTWIVPSAATDLFGNTSSGHIKIDGRLVGNINLHVEVVVAAHAGTIFTLQYSTDNSTWTSATNTVAVSTTGMKSMASPFALQSLSAGFYYFKVVGSGGDGTTSSKFGNIFLEIT